MAHDFAKAMHRSRVLSGAARLVGCSGALAALSLVFFLCVLERHLSAVPAENDFPPSPVKDRYCRNPCRSEVTTYESFLAKRK